MDNLELKEDVETAILNLLTSIKDISTTHDVGIDELLQAVSMSLIYSAFRIAKEDMTKDEVKLSWKNLVNLIFTRNNIDLVVIEGGTNVQ